jgi:hypothetical protein
VDQAGPSDATLAAAKTLAQEVARSFGVRARSGGSLGAPGWPATYFDMKVKHGGMTIGIEVSDRGCNVTGSLAGRLPIFSLNQPTYGVEVPAKRVPELPVPVFLHRRTDEERVFAFLLDRERQRIVSKLALAGKEWLLIGSDRFQLVHLATDVGALRERLDLVAQLMPAPKELRLMSGTAHRIKLGTSAGRAATGAAHSWGGQLEQPAMCLNCHAPAHLMLTIDPTDRSLTLEALGGAPLRVVFCLDCMVFPSLTYVDNSTAHPRIVRQDPAERHNDTPPLELRSITLVEQKSASAGGSKVGGSPKWLQQPEIPDCLTCSESMAFLSQIASTPTLSFVDEGMLYTFVCEKCTMIASLVQSR